MASSTACLPDNGVTRTDYVRFFHEYIRGLDLPEAKDRRWKKTLWYQIVPQVLQRAEAERKRTKERTGIADLHDLKKKVTLPDSFASKTQRLEEE